MAKVTSKATLVLGTNYKYHVVDKQGTDIQIDQTNTRLVSTTTDFTASSEAAGIVKRAIVTGDRLTLSNTGSASNEGVVVQVTTVAANQVDYTVVSGTPADEAAGADINITAFDKYWEFLEAGGLSFVDGVEGIVFASKTVDDWDAGNLDIYPRIFTSIEPRAKSVAALNGWKPLNNDTLKAQRDTALEIRPDATSGYTVKYGLLRSGQLDESTDQFYFWPPTDAEMDPPTAAVTTGYINELVLLEDVPNSVDNRGLWTYRCLENGKTHLQGQLNLQYAEIYTVPSNNAIDPKLADPGTGTPFVSDGTISAGGIYSNVLLNVDADSQYDGDVDGTLRSFVGYVDIDARSNVNAHEKMHYLLRQPSNINSDGTGPSIRGDKAPPITSFSGDLLTFDQYYPLNYDSSERNNLQAVDDGDVTRSWPKVFTLSITSPTLAVGGTFSIMHKDTFGASTPTYLENEGGTPQQDIAITPNTPITISYSTYSVGGHTSNTPIPLVLTWNKPGSIEPDFNDNITMSAANQTVSITPTADPSYTAA